LGTGRVPAGTQLKITGCVSGGSDSTAVDSIPDSSVSHPTEWDEIATLDNYAIIPLDTDTDQLPDMNADIRARCLIAIDTTSLKYQPLQIMDISIKNKAFSPNGDSINDETCVTYYLTKDAVADVDICDLDGSLIKTIRKGSELTAGYQSVIWDGNDQKGIIQPPGLYVIMIRVQASGVSVVKKIGVYLIN
ncbi:MAG: hypothetical protein PHF84_04820, partial [bacterium]|nr:hypothetical protein [bacterium]